MGWKADAGFLAVLGVGVLALAKRLDVSPGADGAPYTFDYCKWLPSWWPGCGDDTPADPPCTANRVLTLSDCLNDRWQSMCGQHVACPHVSPAAGIADVRICTDPTQSCSTGVPAGCTGVRFRENTAWTGRGCTFSVPTGGIHPSSVLLTAVCPYSDAGGVLRG